MAAPDSIGDTIMNVYLSGPMSGRPQFNIPEFNRVTQSLRESGFEVTNPPEEDPPEFRESCEASPDGAVDAAMWGECIGRDVAKISSAGYDGIVMLPGWGDSWGSTMELLTAIKTGIPIYIFCPEEDRDEVNDIAGDDAEKLITPLLDGQFLLQVPAQYQPQITASAIFSLIGEALFGVDESDTGVRH